MKAVAFCPGHITGFFLVRENDDPMKAGSLGAGVCISLGARSEVLCEDGEGIAIVVNGQEAEAKVTRAALEDLLDGRSAKVNVSTVLDLPPSQGFAMSAAGALSACFALAEVLEIPFQRCFEAVHKAEVELNTGLGDVAAMHRGGISFRRKEGLPPNGKVDRVAGSASFILCVVGDKLQTADVITDDEVKKVLEKVGMRCVRSLEKRPTLSNLFRLSREFAVESGLMSPEVKAALNQLKSTGPASMAMLGNSIFCSGELDRQEEILRSIGTTYRAEVDYLGPRILESDHS